MGKRIQMQTYESTVEGATSDGFSTLEGLGEECREAFDNAPESLQQTDRNQRLDEAASTLEGLSEPDVPDAVKDLPVRFQYKPDRRPSRSDRRHEALRILENAKDAAQAWLDDEENRDHADRDEVEQYISEMDDLCSEAENVDFPGMRG